MERWAYHRTTYDRRCTFDRLHINPDLEAKDSHRATAHFYAAQHFHWLLGERYGRRSYDAVRLVVATHPPQKPNFGGSLMQFDLVLRPEP